MLIDVYNCKKLTGQKWLDKIGFKQEYDYYDCEQGCMVVRMRVR